jgi:4'-phosphopantetheinyl transferase
MFISIKRVNSKEVVESLRAFNHEDDIHSLDLNAARPTLTTRRLTTLSLARALLAEKGLLSHEQARRVEIHRLPSGKPFLKLPQAVQQELPSISISHSGSWIGCLLFDKDTSAGIDIEDLTMNRPYERLSAYAFSQEEHRFVSETGEVGFYQLWTAKEAITKCNGEGLSGALKINLSSIFENQNFRQLKKIKIENINYTLYQKIMDNSLLVTLAKKSF